MEKYEVKKVVGQGSFGKAVLCKRKVDARMCIIKQISIKKMSRKEAILTEQEATLLKRLQHPNIVTFWESFVTSTNLYIVMEFADGGDLDHYIKAHAKKLPRKEIPEKQVLHMFVQLSLAIKHIHDRKILHRDLKSQNVFLTSSGQLKLGDFGVSRVLRHTVELAATQIGTPYYMSPEIMNNQRYNSKTDIWSLGCILYELMCLRLPFDGSSMKQLVNNIIKSNPSSPPLAYSSELRELVRDTLCKNPKVRPGINSILARPVMRTKISSLLGETTKQAEFSHTILHGANVLNAPPVAIRQPVSAAAPSNRPSSAGGAPAQPVASSAAQAVAMMQAQRQQQLIRQQQQLQQQQQQFKLQQQKEQKQAQYVSAMAAQVKEQVEMARQAEAARARAQHLQAEEQQRRLRLQAQDRARVEQARHVQQQQAAERAKHAAEALKAKEKQQNEQLEKLRRAALVEQQKKLERRRMERLEYEAQKQKQERERERELQKERERNKEKARVKAAAANNGNNIAAQLGKAGPAAIARRTPSASPVPSGAAPVRQFSAAALLAKRRHSAPEKPPPVRPPWVSVLDEPSPLGGRGPSPTPSNRGRTPSPGPSPRVRGPSPAPSNRGCTPSPGPSPRVRGPSPAPSNRGRTPSPGPSPRVRTPSSANAAPSPLLIPPSGKGNGNTAANNPFSDIVRGVGVGVAAAKVGTPSKECPEEQPLQAKQAQSPLVKKSPYLRPPQCASPVTPLPNAESPTVAGNVHRSNADAMPSCKPLAVRPPSAVSSPLDAQSPGGKRAVAVNDAISKAQDVLQVVQGMHFRGGKAVPRNAAVSSSTDSSSSYGSILPATPGPGTVQESGGNSNNSKRSSGMVPTTTAEVDEDDVADSMAPPLPTPMQPHIHIDTSDSIAASNAGSAAASPWLSDLMGQMGQLKNRMQHLQQLRSPAVNASDDADSPNSGRQSFEDDASSGSSQVSSITAASPASYYRPPSRVPSVANTPRDIAAAAGLGKHAQYAAQQKQRQKQPHQQLQERAKLDRQRMSFPLAESSAEIKRRQKAPAADLVYGHQLEEEEEEEDATSANVSTAAQDSLIHRKESRARHHADFRAFVRAQRQQRAGTAVEDSSVNGLDAHSVASEASVGSAPPVLRIRLPEQQASHQSSTQGMQVSKSAPKLAVMKKGLSPVSTGGSSKPRRSGQSNNPSPAQSPHSVLTSGASCVSASPRSNAAGFNVADFRSQREAQRLEMRQLMKERRQQLRKAEEQFSSDSVVVVSPLPPPNYTTQSSDATPPSTVPTHIEESALTQQKETPRKTMSDYDDTERSRLFEHLQDQYGTSAVQEGLEELVGNATLSSVTMQDYNVLIEQMQAILREPSVRKNHHTRTLQHHAPKQSCQEAGTDVFITPEAQSSDANTAAGAGGLAITRRALVSDLFLEDASAEEAVAADIPVALPVEAEEEGSEDSDAFEEDEQPIDLSCEGGDEEVVLEEGEKEGDGQESSLVDPQEDEDDGFDLIPEELEEEGDGDMCEGDGEQADDFEMLAFPDQHRADDPFLQPLVPAMMTADALLLMDPLRLANISASTPAGVVTPIRGESNSDLHDHEGVSGGSAVAAATADQTRRLQVAELQEYLVGKLGSAKVSQALHLLTVNTAATLTPGEDKHAGYYDERDEELLNRIEDILGTDSLHYLDDMFLLLTLQ